MGVVLQITNGPYTGRKTHLLAGQVLQVGRTEWADFSVPSDARMHDVHFTVAFQSGSCILRDLGTPNGTLVNGQRVTEIALNHADQIQAGTTIFRLVVEGTASGTATGSATANNGASAAGSGKFSGFVRVAPPTAAVICADFSLDADAQAVLTPTITPRDFVTQLIERELYADALRFMAHALPKPEAVWWTCLAARKAGGEKLAEKDAAAIAAAEAWVVESTEENRQQAAKASEASRYETAASFAAAAAAWSGGSLAPPGLPEVPPAPTLTAQAAIGSIRLSAVAIGGAKLVPVQRDLLNLAIDIADAKNRWPEK
ncbi:MAG: FHA domain-containing protein [Planctomycetota bacterium]|nr:FHA domain-containing protein [Planctomycetota bacterium]